jgi:FKBP-type peptidyl-prolyl cis-trans isomerase
MKTMRFRALAILACLASASAAWVVAQEGLPGPGAPAAEQPPTDQRHYSYAIGLDIGASFRADGLPLDAESLLAGLKDGLNAAAQPRYPRELCAASLERLARQRAEMMLKRDADFLAANAKAPGVQTLPSGLQVKVLKQGAGATPTRNDTVQANYTGRFVDGTVFDSTEGGPPATFPVTRVIPAWTEALQKMKVGDKWQLVVPSELGYGPEGDSTGAIPPNTALIFDVELVGIQGQ